MFTQGVLLNGSVRQKGHVTVYGGEGNLLSWWSDMHDRVQMDQQHLSAFLEKHIWDK